jgi:enoyl-CoA hydratase/carnithine racemase
MHLEQIDTVSVLHLGDGENRYNADSLAELAQLIAEVEARSGPKALVLVGDGKFWSNGLDLDWFDSHRDQTAATITQLHELFAIVLSAGFPTVAALQGHCYAGGALMAMALDIRVMREDRGYFCFPEVDLGLPFSPGMSALIAAKLSPQTAQQAMVFGRRYNAPDALTAGIVDESLASDTVLPRAIEIASALAGKSGPAMRTIKSRLHAAVLTALRDPAGSVVDALPGR